MSKKWSVIHKISSEEFKNLVLKSESYTDMARYFNMFPKGGNIRTIKNRIEEENLDVSHLIGRKKNFFRIQKESLTLDKCKEILFIENSYKKRSCVKRYLLKYNLITYKCECGNEGVWNNKKLSLQLDHINGTSNDHRIENLRWICPNCHSQTETFCGKHRFIKKVKKSELNPDCGNKSRFDNRKVQNRPSKEELEKMVWNKPTTEIAKQFKISDSAISKWCKSYRISKPPRGYWSKFYCLVG